MIIAPMATKAEEPVGQHGQRRRARGHVRPPAAAVRLLQAAVRAGHQPADRPDPRERGDVLQAGVGAEVNLLVENPEQAHQLVMDQPILRNHELEKLRQVSHEIFDAATLDITWPIEQGHDGMPSAAGCAVRGGRALRRQRREHPDPVRPQPRPRAGGDALAAGRRGGPPPPGPPRHAPAHRAGDRVRRAARHPPHGDADRLRRGGDQPVRDVRVARRARRPRRCCPRTSTATRPSSGSSRRSARAC